MAEIMLTVDDLQESRPDRAKELVAKGVHAISLAALRVDDAGQLLSEVKYVKATAVDVVAEIAKHLPGKHDQQSHAGVERGGGAGSNYRKRMAEMAKRSRFLDSQAVGGWSDEKEIILENVRTLREVGVRARGSNTTPYEGHLELMIHKDDFPKAVKAMKDYGMEGPLWHFRGKKFRSLRYPKK